MHVDVKGLSVYVDAELIADPLYDIGWKDNHARTKTQGFEFLAIGLTPVTEGPGGDSSVIGDLLSCHCFHNGNFRLYFIWSLRPIRVVWRLHSGRLEPPFGQ